MTEKSKSKAEKDKSQLSNKSKTGEPKMKEKSEDEKPPAEKNKYAHKLKTPRRDLTDSEYERFIEYEKLRKAIRLPPITTFHKNHHDRNAFQLEMTPKQLSINPDEPFKITLKWMLKRKETVIVELDSFLFKISGYTRYMGMKTQVYCEMEYGKPFEFEIALKTDKEAQNGLLESMDLDIMSPFDLAGVLRIGHHEAKQKDYIPGNRLTLPVCRAGRSTGLREYPIQLIKETEQLKKLELMYNVISVEFQRKEKTEKNNFEMEVKCFELKVFPHESLPDINSVVPTIMTVKSLAEKKQKLIINLNSYYHKILNPTGQKDLVSQICCTIMPLETVDFKIGLRTEKEAIDCLKEKNGTPIGNYSLIVIHIQYHSEDEKIPHWTPYNPTQKSGDNSMFVDAEKEKVDKEHGYGVWDVPSKETEATKALKKIFNERYGIKSATEREQLKKKDKKKKCVIQ